MDKYGVQIGAIYIFQDETGTVTAVDPLGLVGQGKKVRGALRDLADKIDRYKKKIDKPESVPVS